MIKLLSKNFTVVEFCKSQTADRLGLNNTPSELVIANATLLAKHVLQPLRDQLKLPIVINSGYRSELVNKSIGGAKTSQHLTGKAADIECPGISNYDLAAWIYNKLPFDQLILEYVDASRPGSGWVHVSYNEGNNRGQALEIKHNPAGRNMPAIKREWKPI